VNWADAIEAMRAGKHVRRRADAEPHDRWVNGARVVYSGEEAMCLRAAWTVDGEPVLVFSGSESRGLFVPEAHHIEATDWEVV
jgi:hypothetical protein